MENLGLGNAKGAQGRSMSHEAQNVLDQDLGYINQCLADELTSLAGKRLLITGGGGFLGYYLVQAITFWNVSHDTTQAISVTVYDNFIRGTAGWLQRLGERGAVTVIPHDIRNPLPANIPDFHFIIHAASIASPTYYRLHPIETMDANINGLRYLLDYARKRKETTTPVEGILFFSTSEIYGNPSPENIPTPETYHGLVSSTGPRSCYDESKRYGETLCVNFCRQYDLPIKMARPFNNYGPGLKITDKRVLADFARDVLLGNDIVLLSDGSPTRTFCYIADAIVGYYKVLVNGRKGEAYNIGVEEPEISMADVAEGVVTQARTLFGYSGHVIRKASEDQGYLIDNPQRRCPIVRKAREDIGYMPSIALNEGLRRMLLWYSGHPDAEVGS